MTIEIEKSEHSRKKNVIRLSFFVIYIIILSLLYYYLTQWGFNPIIVITLLLFLFLITIGLLLRRTKGTLYSRIFPDKKQRTTTIKKKYEKPVQMKIPQQINLDVSYRKPLIKKCNGCGNILPSFAKKCPFCGKQIT